VQDALNKADGEGESCKIRPILSFPKGAPWVGANHVSPLSIADGLLFCAYS